jgi:antitoxin CcdA
MEVLMQLHFFDPSAPKKTTHLSINSDLLRQAREEKINLSQALEKHLAESMLEIKRERWRESSREAIEEYAQFVEKHGCFGDSVRCF